MYYEHKNTTTQNELKQLKPRFSRLLWLSAWKRRRPVLKGKGK